MEEDGVEIDPEHYLEFLRYIKRIDNKHFQDHVKDCSFHAFSCLVRCYILTTLLYKNYEKEKKDFLLSIRQIKDKVSSFREDVMMYLEEEPEIVDWLQKILDSRYSFERYKAMTDNKFPPEVTLPNKCPWTLEELLKDIT